MKFRKMHGLGNDFVIIDSRKESVALTPAQIEHICDRNFGVGCDLLTVLEASENGDVFARFYNADGSESAACGNASRCVADIIMNETGEDGCALETGRGILPCIRAENGMVTVDMGEAVSVEELDLSQDGLSNPIGVNMGNPHCVFFVDDLADIPVEDVGRTVEHNPIFPNRTNVEFVEIINDTKLRQRTWERGVGITLACGSGACAVAVAAHHSGRTGQKVEIELDGGSLFIHIREDGHVLMTGPYAYVFEGELAT